MDRTAPLVDQLPTVEAEGAQTKDQIIQHQTITESAAALEVVQLQFVMEQLFLVEVGLLDKVIAAELQLAVQIDMGLAVEVQVRLAETETNWETAVVAQE
jgi:hypothetical protein